MFSQYFSGDLSQSHIGSFFCFGLLFFWFKMPHQMFFCSLLATKQDRNRHSVSSSSWPVARKNTLKLHLQTSDVASPLALGESVTVHSRSEWAFAKRREICKVTKGGADAAVWYGRKERAKLPCQKRLLWTAEVVGWHALLHTCGTQLKCIEKFFFFYVFPWWCRGFQAKKPWQAL